MTGRDDDDAYDILSLVHMADAERWIEDAVQALYGYADDLAGELVAVRDKIRERLTFSTDALAELEDMQVYGDTSDGRAE